MDQQPDQAARDALFVEMVTNALSSRAHFMQQFLDPRRNLDHECGYPDSSATGYVDLQVYQQLYDREAVAARVVQVMPKESWQITPMVFEDEDVDNATPFEAAWDELGRGLRGGSKYQDELGSAVWEWLLRADIISGIGSYGVILLGLDDGQPLNEPVQSRQGMKLLYLRVFPEHLAPVTRYEADPGSPRYGMPVTYSLSFNDPREIGSTMAAVGATVTIMDVHWSRVIHVADNLSSSEVFGVPRMRPVLNRLLDLRKLYAGSGEMYWRGAFPGLSFETHPQLGGDVQFNPTTLRDQAEQYMNGLQRYLALTGMSAKSLAPQVVDPTPQINAEIEAVCIQLGIPKRVFCGSERGELASSQDDAAWNDRLRHRQRFYLTPRLIVPFVDRLVLFGVLPEPAGYSVFWPDLDSVNAKDKAEVFKQRTEALQAYVSGGVEAIMAPMDYLVREGGYSEEEAAAILDNAIGGQQTDDDSDDAPQVLNFAQSLEDVFQVHGPTVAAQYGLTQEELHAELQRAAQGG